MRFEKLVLKIGQRPGVGGKNGERKFEKRVDGDGDGDGVVEGGER